MINYCFLIVFTLLFSCADITYNNSEKLVDENQDITLAGSWIFRIIAFSKIIIFSEIVTQMSSCQLPIHMSIGGATQISVR